MGSCQLTQKEIIAEKNKCLSEKIKKLKNMAMYQDVVFQFKDTFQVMKAQKEYFGAPTYVETKIDDAIFFSKDSSQCLLIVLKKMKDTAFVFGSARILNGVKMNEKWKFEISLENTFGKDYFALYGKNSFDNISLLARYRVMANGNIKRKGCEIDDYYWFEYLKK
jgi:hypothetical protein